MPLPEPPRHFRPPEFGDFFLPLSRFSAESPFFPTRIVDGFLPEGPSPTPDVAQWPRTGRPPAVFPEKGDARGYASLLFGPAWPRGGSKRPIGRFPSAFPIFVAGFTGLACEAGFRSDILPSDGVKSPEAGFFSKFGNKPGAGFRATSPVEARPRRPAACRLSCSPAVSLGPKPAQRKMDRRREC